jgi:hypothetical protein
VPGAHEEVINTFRTKTSYPADSFGVEYWIHNRSDETIGKMKSGIAYGVSAITSRFWKLAKVSQSLTPKHIAKALAQFAESGFH